MARLRAGLLRRVLAGVAPEAAAAARRLQAEVNAIDALISATLDADGRAYGHGEGERHDAWMAFVRLEGLEPLLALPPDEQANAWERHRASPSSLPPAHAWVCLRGGCVHDRPVKENDAL
jgi:hypothetical protein